MILWWIGDILFVVVLVVVALVLHRLLRPALQIMAYADSIAEDGPLFPPHVAAVVAELARTQQLVAAARPEIERYGRALRPSARETVR